MAGIGTPTGTKESIRADARRHFDRIRGKQDAGTLLRNGALKFRKLVRLEAVYWPKTILQ